MTPETAHGDSPSLHLVRALGSDSYDRSVEVLREFESGIPALDGECEPLDSFVRRARGCLLHAHGRLREQVADELAALLDLRWERLGVSVSPEMSVDLNGRPQEWREAPDAHPPSLRIGPEQIEKKVTDLASRISDDFADAREVHVIGILKSAVTFTADLVRALSIPARVDWVKVSAYGGSGVTADGSLTVEGWNDIRAHNSRVIVVDDALATGTTYAWLRRGLLARGAESVQLCTLMFAEDYSLSGEKPDYYGFVIDWGWPVGYGVDYRERYRNLPGLHQLRLVEGAYG